MAFSTIHFVVTEAAAADPRMLKYQKGMMDRKPGRGRLKHIAANTSKRDFIRERVISVGGLVGKHEMQREADG